jgi:biotin transport system substrate-specific component
MGPRGGYLLGYLIASFVVGKIYQERKSKSAISLFLSMFTGNLIVYLSGFAWLSTFIGIEKAFFLGIVPFAIPDLVKLLFCALGSSQISELLNFLRKK